MENMLIWVCALVTTFTFILNFFKGTRCNIPGPSFLTVALNFHHLGTVGELELYRKWSKKYGEIFQYSVLGKRFVVFNTPETIKSCYNSDDRQLYPSLGAFHLYTGGDYGVTGSKYKTWLEQRKIVVQSLKKFGFRGIETSSQNLSHDVEKIISDLADSACNKPTNIQDHLQLPMMNMIWRMTVSKALNQDQLPLVLRFQTLFGLTLRSKIQRVLGPLIGLIKWELGFVEKYKKSIKEFWSIHKQIIDEHLETLEEGSEPKDFVDEYLNKMTEEQSKGTSFAGNEGMKNLLGTLMDVNLAGAATAFHSLEYIFLHLLLNQDIQDKVREEVEAVVGKSGNVTLENTRSLPYTEACIMEMIRDLTPSPLVVKATAKDTTVEGHFIPAGTFVVGNLWGSNHDENLWDDPFALKPERFLDESGKHLVNTEKVMSFGAGRRKCLGYLVAKDMLVLLLSKIVQRFQILPHPEHKIKTRKIRFDFFLQAPHFKLLMVDRFAK